MAEPAAAGEGEIAGVHPGGGRAGGAGKPRFGLVLLCALALASLFWAGAMRNSRLVNIDPAKSDQGAYIGYAVRLAESGRTWVGNRNQMPLVPALQSFFHRPGMSQQEFFEIGKRVNIAVALLSSLLLAVIYRSLFPLHAAINLALITAFCHLVFRAPYFKAEVHYYLFVTLAFLVGLRSAGAPGAWWGVLFGALCALAHYCKASTQPLLIAFLLVLGVRQVAALRGSGVTDPATRPGMRPALGALLAVMTFLGLLAPYLMQSKRIYGRYFYNVNSTFYIWYDSWKEVKAGTRAAGDRVGWPRLPPDQIPSAARYLKEHSPLQIARRLAGGALVQLKNLTGAHGSFKYLFLAAVCAGVMVWRQPGAAGSVLGAVRWSIAFGVSFLGLLFLATAFYTPMADGSRFVMALYLPLLISGFWLATRLPDADVTLAGKPVSLAGLFQWVVTAILVIEIPFNLLVRLTDEFGGA